MAGGYESLGKWLKELKRAGVTGDVQQPTPLPPGMPDLTEIAEGWLRQLKGAVVPNPTAQPEAEPEPAHRVEVRKLPRLSGGSCNFCDPTKSRARYVYVLVGQHAMTTRICSTCLRDVFFQVFSEPGSDEEGEPGTGI